MVMEKMELTRMDQKSVTLAFKIQCYIFTKPTKNTVFYNTLYSDNFYWQLIYDSHYELMAYNICITHTHKGLIEAATVVWSTG